MVTKPLLAALSGERQLARLRGLRRDLVDPAIAADHGRIVMRTGDGSVIGRRRVVSNFWNSMP